MTESVNMNMGENVKLFLVYLFFSLLMTLPASAKSNDSSRIKELTEVCSLTEEVLQQYILVGLGIDVENTKALIEQNMRAIDSKIDYLGSQFLQNANNKSIAQISLHWNAIKVRLEQNPDYAKATELKAMVDNFVRECLVLDFKVATTGNTPASTNYIKLSELGILSRQMASVYLLTAWSRKPPGSGKHFHELSKEFLEELDELLSSPAQVVPKSVKEILHEVKSELRVFRIFATSNSGRYIPSLAKVKSDRIKNHIEMALKLEEVLLK